MWQVMRINGVGGKVLSGLKRFYDNGRAYVRVSSEESESLEVRMGLRQSCDVAVAVKHVYGCSGVRGA